MGDSRLKNNLKKKAYTNIIITVIGGIVLLILLFFFGVKLLIGFSLLSENLNGNDTTTKSTTSDVYVAPPQLNPLVEATNSAQIAISGYAQQKQTIHLYQNGELIDKTSVRSDNHFTFPSVTLKNGTNTFKALAVTADNKKSDYSSDLNIKYLNKPPELTITQPNDGQGFDKNAGPVSIQGQTDPGATVTVNGFVAIVDDQGKFSYLYRLNDGDNDVKIEATDNAGNKATKEIHIHPN